MTESMERYSYVIRIAGWSFIPSLVTTCAALVVILSSFWTQKASRRTTSAKPEIDTNPLNGTNQASISTNTSSTNPDAFIEEINTSKTLSQDIKSQRSSFISEVYKQLYDEEFDSTADFNQEPNELETNRDFSKDIDETLNYLTDEEVIELKDELKVDIFGNNFKSDLSTGRIEIEYTIQSSHTASSDTIASNNDVRVNISDEINVFEFSQDIETKVDDTIEESMNEAVRSNDFIVFDKGEHLGNLPVMHAESAEKSVFDEILGAVLFEQISDIITPLVIENDYSVFNDKHSAEIMIQLQDLPIDSENIVTNATLTQIIPIDIGGEEKAEENSTKFQNGVFEKEQSLSKPVMSGEKNRNEEQSLNAKTTHLPVIASTDKIKSTFSNNVMTVMSPCIFFDSSTKQFLKDIIPKKSADFVNDIMVTDQSVKEPIQEINKEKFILLTQMFNDSENCIVEKYHDNMVLDNKSMSSPILQSSGNFSGLTQIETLEIVENYERKSSDVNLTNEKFHKGEENNLNKIGDAALEVDIEKSEDRNSPCFIKLSSGFIDKDFKFLHKPENEDPLESLDSHFKNKSSAGKKHQALNKLTNEKMVNYQENLQPYCNDESEKLLDIKEIEAQCLQKQLDSEINETRINMGQTLTEKIIENFHVTKEKYPNDNNEEIQCTEKEGEVKAENLTLKLTKAKEGILPVVYLTEQFERKNCLQDGKLGNIEMLNQKINIGITNTIGTLLNLEDARSFKTIMKNLINLTIPVKYNDFEEIPTNILRMNAKVIPESIKHAHLENIKGIIQELIKPGADLVFTSNSYLKCNSTTLQKVDFVNNNDENRVIKNCLTCGRNINFKSTIACTEEFPISRRNHWNNLTNNKKSKLTSQISKSFDIFNPLNNICLHVDNQASEIGLEVKYENVALSIPQTDVTGEKTELKKAGEENTIGLINNKEILNNNETELLLFKNNLKPQITSQSFKKHENKIIGQYHDQDNMTKIKNSEEDTMINFINSDEILHNASWFHIFDDSFDTCEKETFKKNQQSKINAENKITECLRNQAIEHRTIHVNFTTMDNSHGYTHNSSSTLTNEKSIPNVSCDFNEIETIHRNNMSNLFSAQSSNQSIAECVDLPKSKGPSLQLLLNKDNIIIESTNSSLNIVKSRKNSCEIDLTFVTCINGEKFDGSQPNKKYKYLSKHKLCKLDHVSSSENKLEPSLIDHNIKPDQHSISRLSIHLSHNICFSQNPIQVHFSHEMCVIPNALIDKSVQNPSDIMEESIKVNIMSVSLGLTDKDLDCGHVTTTTYTQTFPQHTLDLEKVLNLNPQETCVKDNSNDTVYSNIDQNVPLYIYQLNAEEPPKREESLHFDDGLQKYVSYIPNHELKGFSQPEIIERRDTFVQKTSDIIVAKELKRNGTICSSKEEMLESQFTITIPMKYVHDNNKPIDEWPNISTNEVFPKNKVDMKQPSEVVDENNDLAKVSLHNSILHIHVEEKLKIKIDDNRLKQKIYSTAQDPMARILAPMLPADLKESSVMLGKVMNKHSKHILNEQHIVNVPTPINMDTIKDAQQNIAGTNGNTVSKHLVNMDDGITLVVPQKDVIKETSELVIYGNCNNGNEISVRDDINLECVKCGYNILTPHNVYLEESQRNVRCDVIKKEQPNIFSDSKTTFTVSITQSFSKECLNERYNLNQSQIKPVTNAGSISGAILADKSKLLSQTNEYYEIITTNEFDNVKTSYEDNINRSSEKGKQPMYKNHSTQMTHENKSTTGKVKRTLTVAYLLDQSEKKKSPNNMSNLSKRPSLENIHSNNLIINKLNINKSVNETNKNDDSPSEEFAKTLELDESETFQNEMTYTSVHNMNISVARKNNDNFEIPTTFFHKSTKVIPESIQNITANNIKRLMHDLVKPCVDIPWDLSHSENGFKCKLTESTCPTNYIESKTSWQNVSNVHFEPATPSTPISERSQPPNIIDLSKAFDLQNPLNNVNFSFKTIIEYQNERNFNRTFDVVNPLNNVCLNINKFIAKMNESKQSQGIAIGPSLVESVEDTSREERTSSSFGGKKNNDTKENVSCTVLHKSDEISANSKVLKKKKTVLVKEAATEMDSRFDPNNELDLDDALAPSVDSKRHRIKKTKRVKDGSTEPFNPNHNDSKSTEDVTSKKKTKRAKSATTEPMVNDYYLDWDTVAALSAKKKKNKRVKNQGTIPINIEPVTKDVSKSSNDSNKTGESLENRKFNILYMFGRKQKYTNDIIEKPDTKCKKKNYSTQESFKDDKHKLCNLNYNFKTNQRTCRSLISHIENKSVADIKKFKPEEQNKRKKKYLSTSEKTELLKTTSVVGKVWKVKRSGTFAQSQITLKIKYPSDKFTLDGKYHELQTKKAKCANESLTKSDKPKDFKKSSSAVLLKKSIIAPESTATDNESYHTAIDDQKMSAKDLLKSRNTRFEHGLHTNPEGTEEPTNPIISEINRYSFMGTWACRWECCTSADWSFLLLHERVRLSVRFPSSERQCLHPDTPVLAIDIESVDKVDRAVAAHATTVCVACLRSFAHTDACGRAGDLPALLTRCARAVGDTARWARAMQHASAHLGYRLDQGVLTFQIANVPLRSVWDVSLRVACEPRAPRATDVRIAAVCSDVEVSPARVTALLRDVKPGWANVPQTLWRLYRSLKYMTIDHPWSSREDS